MGNKFIGRAYELERLGDLLQGKTSHFVVIKGRRRIGKSRLIEEFAHRNKDDILDFVRFSGMPPAPGTSAQDQRDDFALQMARLFKIPTPYAQDWGDLFWHLHHQMIQLRTQSPSKKAQKKIILVLDEISWMGMKDHTFLGKLKTAWDTLFKQDLHLILILCGSVSSWIEQNILKNTGFVGRIDLVFALDELSFSESLEMFGRLGQKLSAQEVFKILSVTGGVPRYLELIDPRYSAEENIKKHCFVPEGFLYREFDNIFNDLFSTRSGIYKTILEALLKNPNSSLDDIFEFLNRKKSGVLVEYLEDLNQAGFVSRDHTWSLRDGRPSALSHFRISDNYVRFYLKYVEPQKAKIEKGLYAERSLAMLPGWETIMGLQFENLVIKNRKLLLKALRIDPHEVIHEGPYFQRKTKSQQGCQIDYLIQNQYNSYYPCEIKFSQTPLGLQVAQESAQKVKALSLPKNVSCRPVLIHVNGVEDRLIAEEFFAHIVDFKDMLR
jgi:AAA+ ATPase superfamily predicted ATPase